jgi:spore maturation protein CgeB
MKKITKTLLVGATSQDPSIYTYASSFYSTLQKLGYSVELFNYRTQTYSWLPAKAKQWLINQQLIQYAKRFQPDLVFLLKAENIQASTLSTIKQLINTKIINFFPDNPFAIWNGNSSAEVLKSLPLYTCFLSWSKMLIPALESAGAPHACYFPFAYDETIFDVDKTVQELDAKRYDFDVCFVGTWEPEREEWLSVIAEKLPTINLGVWGNGWREQCSSEPLKRHLCGNAVYNSSLVKIFQQTKIVLNFIRKQNITSHNIRTFEVPATGAFLLTQRTYEQAELLFTEDKHIGCFSTPEELISKIRFFVQNSSIRASISQQGHHHVKTYRLSYQLKKFLDHCPKLNN